MVVLLCTGWGTGANPRYDTCVLHQNRVFVNNRNTIRMNNTVHIVMLIEVLLWVFPVMFLVHKGLHHALRLHVGIDVVLN